MKSLRFKVTDITDEFNKKVTLEIPLHELQMFMDDMSNSFCVEVGKEYEFSYHPEDESNSNEEVINTLKEELQVLSEDLNSSQDDVSRLEKELDSQPKQL